MTPRRSRIWHVPRVARILWAEEPRADWRARLGDLRLLAGLARRGRILHVGRGWLRGFLIRDGVRIHALYTDPRARRQGVGSRLIRRAQDEAEAGRLELWTAQDNAPARAFYEAHGFYAAGFGFGQGNDEGRPDLRLIWERNAP